MSDETVGERVTRECGHWSGNAACRSCIDAAVASFKLAYRQMCQANAELIDDYDRAAERVREACALAVDDSPTQADALAAVRALDLAALTDGTPAASGAARTAPAAETA